MIPLGRAQGVKPLIALFLLTSLTGCPKDTPLVPIGSCGANLHGDDSTCKNGDNDVGELCLEAADTRPISQYMYEHNNLALADYNGDGHLDLRVGGDVYAGKGDGTFSATYMRPGYGVGIEFAPVPSDVAEGEFNGDGLTDIVYTYMRIDDAPSEVQKTIAIWFGNEKLDFAPSEYHDDLSPCTQPA